VGVAMKKRSTRRKEARGDDETRLSSPVYAG
jgi:hypothetical protein